MKPFIPRVLRVTYSHTPQCPCGFYEKIEDGVMEKTQQICQKHSKTGATQRIETTTVL